MKSYIVSLKSYLKGYTFNDLLSIITVINESTKGGDKNGKCF